jgi:hypothetical protein
MSVIPVRSTVGSSDVEYFELISNFIFFRKVSAKISGVVYHLTESTLFYIIRKKKPLMLLLLFSF